MVGDYFKIGEVSGVRMEEVLGKAKSIAKFSHQSSVALRTLKEAARNANLKFTKLKNPNVTRWNSAWQCMESLLKNKAVLDIVFEEEEGEEWTSRKLSSSEWKLLQGAVEVLRFVQVVTKSWEAEATPTVNLVISELYTLETKLKDFIADSSKSRSVILKLKTLNLSNFLVLEWELVLLSCYYPI